MLNKIIKQVCFYFICRHSRFGGTYVLKDMKSVSDNDIIYHKPLNKLDSLDFDQDKVMQIF
jgi:timeless